MGANFVYCGLDPFFSRMFVDWFKNMSAMFVYVYEIYATELLELNSNAWKHLTVSQKIINCK